MGSKQSTVTNITPFNVVIKLHKTIEDITSTSEIITNSGVNLNAGVGQVKSDTKEISNIGITMIDEEQKNENKYNHDYNYLIENVNTNNLNKKLKNLCDNFPALSIYKNEIFSLIEERLINNRILAFLEQNQSYNTKTSSFGPKTQIYEGYHNTREEKKTIGGEMSSVQLNPGESITFQFDEFKSLTIIKFFLNKEEINIYDLSIEPNSNHRIISEGCMHVCYPQTVEINPLNTKHEIYYIKVNENGSRVKKKISELIFNYLYQNHFFELMEWACTIRTINLIKMK